MPWLCEDTTDVLPINSVDLHASHSASMLSAAGTGILDIRPTSSTVGAWELKNAADECPSEKGEIGGRGNCKNCATESAGFGKRTFCKAGGISSARCM